LGIKCSLFLGGLI